MTMPKHVIARFGVMPKFALSEKQVRDVSRYVWSLSAPGGDRTVRTLASPACPFPKGSRASRGLRPPHTGSVCASAQWSSPWPGSTRSCRCRTTSPGTSDEPTILWAFQAVIALCGLGAAYGAWRYRAWSWVAALGYAVITSGMILGLGPILDLDAEAREQLPLGAGLVFVVTGLLAWYLRRATATSGER
jgi:hypothetical protein